MPTRSTSSSTTDSGSTTPAATSSLPSADELNQALEESESSTVYIDLGEGATAPTDEELAALVSEGLHAEFDVVRQKLAVRKASDDEVAQTAAESEPEPEPAASSSSSPSSSSSSSSSTPSA